jgi:aryl-alcohol dehydrogenase-like predicted oxidoreductase
MEIILGTAQLNRPYGLIDTVSNKTSFRDPSELIELAKRTSLAGVDTAPVYGDSEVLLGRAGMNIPLHTKLRQDCSVNQSIEQSKRNLRVDFLPLVYIHQELTGHAAQRSVIQQLRARPDVGEIGASIYSQEELNLAVNDDDISVIQLPYNVLDRRFSAGNLRLARSRGKKIFGRSALLQGLLTESFILPQPLNASLMPYVSAFRSASSSLGVTSLVAAIAFASRNSNLSALVIGAKSRAQLAEIVAAQTVPIPEGLLEELDVLRVPAPDTVDPRNWSVLGLH